MAKPVLVLKIILSAEMKYPDDASFCFEGYKGVNKEHELVSLIIDHAIWNNGSIFEVGLPLDELTLKPFKTFFLFLARLSTYLEFGYSDKFGFNK